MKFRALAVSVLALLTLTACHARRKAVLVSRDPDPRPVSIDVEVYHPDTGFVWQDVGVRIVEAYNEWSGTTLESPFFEAFEYTDGNGLVFFDEARIADADVGFIEDTGRLAVLSADPDADEAIVTLEVWAPGHVPVFVDVNLSWDTPDAVISVPFD